MPTVATVVSVAALVLSVTNFVVALFLTGWIGFPELESMVIKHKPGLEKLAANIRAIQFPTAPESGH